MRGRRTANRALDHQEAVEGRQASFDSAQTGAGFGIGPAPTIVGHTDPQLAVLDPQVDVDPVGAGVFHHVAQQFGDREVGSRLQCRTHPLGNLDVHLRRYRTVRRQGPHGVAQPAVGQHRGMDSAHQVTQLAECRGGGVLGLGQQRLGGLRVAAHHGLGGVDGHAHRHQTGLGAVVEVAFDAAQLGRGGVADLPPGL